MVHEHCHPARLTCKKSMAAPLRYYYVKACLEGALKSGARDMDVIIDAQYGVCFQSCSAWARRSFSWLGGRLSIY
jgi:hypothetical protein